MLPSRIESSVPARRDLPEQFKAGDAHPGDVFFDPQQCRYFRVTEQYTWEDVTLLYVEKDSFWEYRIRLENVQRNQSNYMPKQLPVREETQDIDFEEV